MLLDLLRLEYFNSVFFSFFTDHFSVLRLFVDVFKNQLSPPPLHPVIDNLSLKIYSPFGDAHVLELLDGDAGRYGGSVRVLGDLGQVFGQQGGLGLGDLFDLS